MKIAVLSSSRIPSIDANAIQVRQMCRAFVACGHDVTLFASGVGSPDHQRSADGFRTRIVSRSSMWPVASAIYGFKVGQSLGSEAFDLAYARCPHSAFHAGLRRMPFIYEAHNVPTNRLRRALEARLFRMASFRGLVVISSALATAYLKMFASLSGRNVAVAHDGAWLPEIDSTSDYCRCRAKGEEGVLDIGYFGSMYAGKGIEVVVALAKLRPQHTYHVYGGPSDRVKYWTSKSNSSAVLYGPIDHSEVQEKMRSMDVLLLPNQVHVETRRGGDIGKYTSPLKMFEYMGAGRPIVASALPTLTEVLRHRETALLVQSNDWNAWASAVDELANNPALRQSLARAALCQLRDKYTWTLRAEIVLAGVQACAGNSRPSSRNRSPRSL